MIYFRNKNTKDIYQLLSTEADRFKDNMDWEEVIVTPKPKPKLEKVIVGLFKSKHHEQIYTISKIYFNEDPSFYLNHYTMVSDWKEIEFELIENESKCSCTNCHCKPD
jgi:hypothetical protein